MYTKEQKERALKEYVRLGSVKATITYLGYPSRRCTYVNAYSMFNTSVDAFVEAFFGEKPFYNFSPVML